MACYVCSMHGYAAMAVASISASGWQLVPAHGSDLHTQLGLECITSVSSVHRLILMQQ
jgi:hypothetical protein